MAVDTDPGPNDLVNWFLDACGTIENHLRKELGAGPSGSFSRMVAEYGKSHPFWAEQCGQLSPLIGLRNALVHGRDGNRPPVAVPTPSTVDMVRRIADEFLEPEPAIRRFKTEVSRLEVTDTLSKVAGIMRTMDYSQFPVYQEGQFQGVLTERGLARWLVRRLEKRSTVEFKDETVRAALELEEKRRNYQFAPSDLPVWQVAEMFATNLELEVVLITEEGCEQEEPLGIATVLDIARLQTAQ